jgi:hypothetical protein
MIHVFGVRGALTSNSTLGPYPGWGPDLKAKFTAQPSRFELIARNLASTSVPVCVRPLALFDATLLEAPCREEVCASPTSQETVPAQDRGLVFRIGVLDAAVGWTGVALLIAAGSAFAVARLRGRPWPSYSGLWLYLLIIGLPVNLSAIGWYCVYGTLAQNLQPYVCLAAVFVVSWLRTLSPRWALALGFAWLLECGARTAFVLSYQTRLLPLHAKADGVQADAVFRVDGDYFQNYGLKVRVGAVLLRDLVPEPLPNAVVALALLGLGFVCYCVVIRSSKRVPP